MDITRNTIISNHLNLLNIHPWVAAVNTNIPINDVKITNNPCQMFSIPINNS